MSKVAKEAFIRDVKQKYLNGDEGMFTILGIIKPSMNMTLEESFEAYCELMNWSDKDAFLRVNQDDDFCIDIIADKEYKCSEIFVA